MPINVQVEGLGSLEFPDGTPDDVIDSAVKREIQSVRGAAPVSPRQDAAEPRQSGSIFDAILGQLGGIGGPVQVAPSPSPESQPEEYAAYTKGLQKTVSGTARYGLPIATALAAPPAVLPQIGYGLVGGIAGEGIAQTAERAAGEREAFDVGDIAGAGVRGAAPMMARGGALARAAGSGLSQAAGALAGRTLEEGRLPTIQEAAVDVGIAGTLGTIFGGIGGMASTARKAISGAPFERAQKMAEAGIDPTIGQLFPSLAATEQRIAARVPGGPITERLLQQSRQVGSALRALTPGGDVRSLQDLGTDLIEVLGARGGADYDQAVKLFTQAQEALSTAQTAAQREVATDAINRMRERIQSNIEEYSTKLVRDAAQEVAGGLTPQSRMTPASGGAFMEQFGGNLKKSFDDLAKGLYSGLEQVSDNPLFTVQSIKKSAQDELNRLSKGVKSGQYNFGQELIPALEKIVDLPDSASLNQIRNVQREIFELADFSGAYRSPAQGKLTQLGKQFADVVDKQATTAFGQQLGDQLKRANAIYRDIRPRFAEYGVASLFQGPEKADARIATGLVNDILTNGAESQTWRNIKDLSERLEASGAANIPSLDDIKTIVREQIVGQAFNANLGSLDVNKMAESIGKINRASPGFAKELGFGDAEQFAMLQAISDAFPNANRIPAEQFTELLRTSDPKDVMDDLAKLTRAAGKRIVDPGIESKAGPVMERVARKGVEGLETDIGRYMARMSAIENVDEAASLRKIGLSKEAETKLVEARDMALAAGEDVKVVQEQARARRSNPILAALNLVEEGVPVGPDDGAQFFRSIQGKSPQFIEEVHKWLGSKASKGDELAGTLLRDWRRFAMEDLLLGATKKDARGEFIDARELAAAFAESDLRVKDSQANNLRVQIGQEAFEAFKKRILPAIRVIGERQQEAGQAAATVTGRGPEDAIRKVGEASKALAEGKPAGALDKVINAVLDLGYTQVAARIFTDAPNNATLRRLITQLQRIDVGSTAFKGAMIEGQLMDAFEE